MMRCCTMGLMGLFAFLTNVLPVQAEVYKWVDKDGTVRYSDTPPPVGAKPLSTIGKKVTKPAAVDSTSNNDAVVNTSPSVPKADKNEDASSEALAKKKRELDEVTKKNKAELEAQAKKKAQNCATARTNYQTYSQGGRIYKTNERGEREYIDEKAMAEGASQAQRDMQEYCS